MLQGLLAAKQGVAHVTGRLPLYVVVNILWLLCSLPIITAPAAWAGLCRFSYQALRQPTADVAEFWVGLRGALVQSLPLGLLGAVIVVSSISNLFSYTDRTSSLTATLRMVWIGLPVLWFAVQLYAFPIVNAQIDRSLLRAYRNATTMILLNPFFTLGIWLAAGGVIALSIVLPFAWVLVSGALLAGIGNYAVYDRLRAAGVITAPPPSGESVGTFADFEGYN